MALSRRQVLALGSLSAIGLSAGGAAMVAGEWWDRPAADGFTYLSLEEGAFIRALAGAAFPATPQIPHCAEDLDIDHFFDAALAHLPDDQRKLARMGLHALDNWPGPLRGSAYSSLDVATRATVLQVWLTHSRPQLRQATSSLLLVSGMGFCTHPKVAPFFQAWHVCGYGR